MNIFALYHGFLSIEIQSFKDYINQMDDSLEPFLKKIQKQFLELQAIPDDDPIKDNQENEESYFDFLISETVDQHYQYNEFQQRYRYSVIIQLYTFLETELTKIAFNRHDKVNGNVVEATKKKLKPKVDITKIKEYNFIKDFTNLRNVIVHSNGKLIDSIPKDVKKINSLKALKKTNGLEVKMEEYPKSKVYTIQITEKDFLLSCLNNIEDFLDSLYIELKK